MLVEPEKGFDAKIDMIGNLLLKDDYRKIVVPNEKVFLIVDFYSISFV